MGHCWEDVAVFPRDSSGLRPAAGALIDGFGKKED
jgi:hypothetical protein